MTGPVHRFSWNVNGLRAAVRRGARERRVGWRIDSFFISSDLERRVIDARFDHQVRGSDNCPIELALEL